MARSPGYTDFSVRLKEVISLLRLAKKSPAFEASICSKSASVLLAACLERYVNDAIDHSCRQISTDDWAQLPDGVKKFMIAQFSRRLANISDVEASPSAASISDGNKLKAVTQQVVKAFEDPSSWNHLPEHGPFMEGATAPDRLSAILSSFRTDGETIFEQLEAAGRNRGHFARSLTDLIESRHSVAHAIASSNTPSPSDVTGWVAVTFHLARQIEIYLDRWE